MNELIAAVQENSKILGGFRYPLVAGAIAAIVSYLLTPWVRSFAISRGAIDDPKSDDRRVHTEPTPRWGGIAIYGGIVAALAVVMPFAYHRHPLPMYLFGILLCSAAVVFMGA